jgi:hypothetical protein
MTYVPSLRETLQDAAERRYGRRRRAVRWSAFAALPAAAAVVAAFVLATPDAERERAPEPAAKVHTVKVTNLPPRPRAAFRIVDPVGLAREEGLAAQRAVAKTSADDGALIRAYTVPGTSGAAILLTRRKDRECVSAIEPASGDFPGQWASACGGRETGVGLNVGDTYVGYIGRGNVTPTYRAPGRRAIRLWPNKDGLVVIQGAANGASVRISDRTPDRIEIGQDARYHCSDGTSIDVRVDNGPITSDPCE